MPICPTCGKPTVRQENPWRPFCSERCKLIDFGRWTNEEYRVPGQKINPADGSEPNLEDSAEDVPSIDDQ
jgi:uncharacterized protein